ncbi:MAG: single-stranded DNA-binding protein [Ruminococcaceae bacterium]|nr:single-stranded DNA-binding protein [Oscillospiraceae bacterium]MBQ2780509.1 single-stranded DNA-binding protein [Clostridia bacterium]MBQ7302882.1 single-stranded DNA-binding protein [Clostridia bacterium]
MNVVCLIGRLVADPELKHTQANVSVCSFRIAVDRSYQAKGQERQADFINIVAWRQSAEFICRYFHKGSRISVVGSLQSRDYTDQNGNKRTVYEVVCDNVGFVDPKTTNNAGGYQPAYQPTDSQVPTYTESQPAFSTASGDFEEIVGDDELPF